MSQHVFLSYCHDNQDEVETLRNELLEEGFKVWWDMDIFPGQDWRAEIRKAMRNAAVFVVCLSLELAERSRSGVYSELADAIEELRLRPANSIFVIPVRLSECEIPELRIDGTRTLNSLQFVDLFPENERARSLKRLKQSIRRAIPEAKVSADTPSVERMSRLKVTIDMEHNDFSSRDRNLLKHGLADFLKIEPEQIKVIAVDQGSVIVTLSMPEPAARNLLLRRSEPGFSEAVKLPILSISLSESQGFDDAYRAKISTHKMLMDGQWPLDTLTEFTRLYSQVYSVLYSLAVEHGREALVHVRNLYQSYPWQGGFSRLNFFTSVKNAVPTESRPFVKSISYASPGQMTLSLVSEVADEIRDLAEAIDNAGEVYAEIYREMRTRGMNKMNVRGSEIDDNDYSEAVSNKDMAFVQMSLLRLSSAMKFPHLSQLSLLTGNRLASLKILMSLYRRIRDLKRTVGKDLIQL